MTSIPNIDRVEPVFMTGLHIIQRSKEKSSVLWHKTNLTNERRCITGEIRYEQINTHTTSCTPFTPLSKISLLRRQEVERTKENIPILVLITDKYSALQHLKAEIDDMTKRNTFLPVPFKETTTNQKCWLRPTITKITDIHNLYWFVPFFSRKLLSETNQGLEKTTQWLQKL